VSKFLNLREADNELTVVFLGTLNSEIAICQYNSEGEYIPGQAPGCYNLFPVFQWIRHCIISILLVFGIAFLPLFLQGM
jgi:1,3-beta-glucan synthase